MSKESRKAEREEYKKIHSTAFIQIKNVKKTYQVTRTEKQDVLKGIDVELNRGEFVALLGESGCGKSTFLNIIAGLDFDYSGSILINREFISDFNEKDLDLYRKKSVGIIFQNFNLIKTLTAYENIMMPLSLSELSHEERKARVDELLADVGLTDHANKKPNQLSGGQKQRVAIARALAMNPTLIVADEPTGNLDSQSADEVMGILKKLAANGKLVVCVTHSAKVAANCTRVLKMEDGIIVSDEISRSDNKKYELEEPFTTKDNIDKKEILSFAKNNIKQNLKRSILVTTALSIGICAFVLMFFFGVGMRSYVENDLATGFNKRQINVYAGYRAANVFTDDTPTVQGQMSYLNTVASMYSGTKVHEARILNNFKVSYGNDATKATSKNDKILSVSTYYEGFTAKKLYGDTIVKNIPTNDMGIIISSGMMEVLSVDGEFDMTKPVYLSLNGGAAKEFTITGVMDDGEGFDTAYISMYGMGQLGFSTNNMAYVIANKVSNIKAIINDINYDETKLFAFQPDTLADDVMGYIDMGSMLLAIVSAISLVVSAIMIFIVMYISVLERNKEIGTLRSIGVRRRDVKRIFITEAGIIGLAAGVAGVIGAVLIGLFTNLGAGSWIVGVTWWPILIGLAAGFFISILSSMGPAGSGASLDPVEALRAND